tara:strand:- start:790 stop:1263 length:474 start_codon:yes stop_codon:yes gene_type:complete
MKKILLLFVIVISQSIYSQTHIGIMGGYDLDMENSQIGVGLNYMLFPKVSLGGMLMISDIESDGKSMVMLNGKYHFGRVSLIAGIMNMEMHNMGMNMNMSQMYDSDQMDRETKPYFGLEYKPFKNKKLKLYYTHSDMMKSIGIMLPIFHLGKKMKMQ